MGGRIHRLKPDGEWLLQREWKSQIRQRLEELALFSSVMVKKSAMGRFLFDLRCVQEFDHWLHCPPQHHR